ncbi:MAG: aminoacyl-tRNA hydrolase [Deltaproteobacteria bacterium]|jgi:PTH1 family peptidyl-tRNA hydrolase|nr:aminoacyl-tRNA hydrolase [Deltaproteobacteria bacterium]
MELSGTRIIVGLGNPGRQYAETRHNVGFMALEALVGEDPYAFGRPSAFKSSQIATGTLEGARVILAWPQTFMNLSGVAVRELAGFYKISVADGLLVVHDEMDLPPGKVKATLGGGSAGHKGIESIREFVRGNFARLRIGIGRPPKEDRDEAVNVDWVLSRFAESELEAVESSLKAAGELIRVWLKGGIEAAQRVGNRKPPKPRKAKEAKEVKEAKDADEGNEAKEAKGGDEAWDAGGREAVPKSEGFPIVAEDAPKGKGGQKGEGG